VGPNGRALSGGEVFATCDPGLFDGFRLDVRGNILDEPRRRRPLLQPDGTLLGKINVPEVVANVCFGGPKRNRLFIAATTSLYAIFVQTQGALRP